MTIKIVKLAFMGLFNNPMKGRIAGNLRSPHFSLEWMNVLKPDIRKALFRGFVCL